MNQAICSNLWCRVIFKFEGDETPKECPKCSSFNTHLSGGVTWTDKVYDGSRYDNTPHITKIDVKKYFK